MVALDNVSTTLIAALRWFSPAVGLKQPYLVLQLKVPSGQPFGVEFATTDVSGGRHRLLFSTAFREPHTKALHTQFPLPGLPRSMWTNVCFCLHDLMSKYRDGVVFSTLDAITIRANCAVRNVFTLRTRPPATVPVGVSQPSDVGALFARSRAITGCVRGCERPTAVVSRP